jgi:putative hemolysin
MLLEIGVILLLILANGIFASAEMAIVSARSGRLQQLADQGNQGAMQALALRNDPHRFLSTVQIGITLIGALTGVFSGATIASRLSVMLADLPVIGPFAEQAAFFVVVAAIAYLSLVVGELVPKRLSLQSAEPVAMRLARTMLVLQKLSYPLVVLLGWSAEVLLTLLGRRDAAQASVTEEDIRQLVHEGAQEGSVDPQEERVIEGVFKLGERNVRQIMTPRVDVSALDADARVADILDEVIQIGYSRYPVYEESQDEIVGVVHVRDLLYHYRTHGEDAHVRDAMLPPTIVPEHARASLLLATFRRNQRHLAVVVSDLGSIEGVVTLEDVLEEIVGEIRDEHDEIESQAITVRDDGSLLVDGVLPIDRLKQRLGVEELPDEELYHYGTLAGFVLSLLGRIPEPGDSIHWGGWRFEVMDMDGLRIDKMLLDRETPDEDAAEEQEQQTPSS